MERKAKDQLKLLFANSPEAVKWLRNKCYVDKTTYDFTGKATVFREGRRSVYLDIMKLINDKELEGKIENASFQIV